MKRKRLLPNDPREWIARAKSNLVRAGSVIEGVELEDLCFDAQQAGEKAIKAVFIHRGDERQERHMEILPKGKYLDGYLADPGLRATPPGAFRYRLRLSRQSLGSESGQTAR